MNIMTDLTEKTLSIERKYSGKIIRECVSCRSLRDGSRGRNPQRDHLRFQDVVRLALLEDRKVVIYYRRKSNSYGIISSTRV